MRGDRFNVVLKVFLRKITNESEPEETRHPHRLLRRPEAPDAAGPPMCSAAECSAGDSACTICRRENDALALAWRAQHLLAARRTAIVMDPGGPRLSATARRTGVRDYAASVLAGLLVLACSIEQPVSGSVVLTGEWKVIDPPEPLRVEGKHRQAVCLHVDVIRDADFDNSVVVMGSGQRHVVEGEALDNEGTKYALEVRERGGRHFCLYRSGERPPGGDFPEDRTIVSLRLRSEPPLQVVRILWHSYDQR